MQPSGEPAERRQSVQLPYSPGQAQSRSRAGSHFHDEARTSAHSRTQTERVATQLSQHDNESHAHDSRRPSSLDLHHTLCMASSSAPGATAEDCTARSADLSDQDLLYDMYAIIMQAVEPHGADLSFAFERAAMTPPITLDSLAELDMARIINNPKLRHDVNFDRDLHFRPNREGSKGRSKLRAAEQYWLALEAEFFVYAYAAERLSRHPLSERPAYWVRMLSIGQRRLPPMLVVIRDVLLTLVPDHEQATIAARLDVDLIMKQITNGVCDLVGLGNWLANLLKAHCAPMRDEHVDAMRDDLVAGATLARPDRLVAGLRRLLVCLENMKLDVANHQVRHMRLLLVNDTLHFQRRYHAHRIALGKFDLCRARAWFAGQLTKFGSSPRNALVAALLNHVRTDDPAGCPPSFYLDEDRLGGVRAQLRRVVGLAALRALVSELGRGHLSPADLAQAQEALVASALVIVGSHGRFIDCVENIAVEVVRMLCTASGSTPTFAGAQLAMIETRLRRALDPASAEFDARSRAICAQLRLRLNASVERHINMSALQLHNTLLPPQPQPTGRPPVGFGAQCAPPPAPSVPQDAQEHIVRQMTHVLCLNWHIWADLIYLLPPAALLDDGLAEEQDPTGIKWHPMGMPVAEVTMTDDSS